MSSPQLPQNTPSQLPPEIIQQIFDDIGDDKKTNLTAATLSRAWLLQQRPACLAKLLFHNEEDVLAFLNLTSAQACTFPLPIACNDISFYGCTQSTAAISNAVSRVSSPQTLTIGIRAGKIPQPVTQAMQAWKGTIRKLKISGGAHNPRTFFPTISSLPHLEELELQDFNFQPAKTRWWRQEASYAFPKTLKTLSVIGDVSLFKFLLERVVPDGGFSKIAILSVETRFLPEDIGVSDMFNAFRSLSTVSTLRLRPTYNPACLNLKSGMDRIFSSHPPLLFQIRGFEKFELDFSDTPAEWALNTVAACALSTSSRGHGVDIDVRIPRAPKLWDEQGPAAQLEQLLEEMYSARPLVEGRRKVSLVVRDFPADLPERFKAAPTLCGVPVTFINAGVCE